MLLLIKKNRVHVYQIFNVLYHGEYGLKRQNKAYFSHIVERIRFHFNGFFFFMVVDDILLGLKMFGPKSMGDASKFWNCLNKWVLDCIIK